MALAFRSLRCQEDGLGRLPTSKLLASCHGSYSLVDIMLLGSRPA